MQMLAVLLVREDDVAGGVQGSLHVDAGAVGAGAPLLVLVALGQLALHRDIKWQGTNTQGERLVTPESDVRWTSAFGCGHARVLSMQMITTGMNGQDAHLGAREAYKAAAGAGLCDACRVQNPPEGHAGPVGRGASRRSPVEPDGALDLVLLLAPAVLRSF
eukprot:6369953-Pyramimonas_sp.AAC.1